MELRDSPRETERSIGTTMRYTRPRVLLVTAASWLGFSRFPRILHAAGADVDLICPPDAVIASSRFISKVCYVDGGLNAVCQEFRKQLEEQPGRYAWIVVGDDELFRAVGEQCSEDELRGWYPVKNDAQTRLFFASKHEFHERCAKLGLGVAPFRTCRDRSEAESALAEIGFPMVAKKLTSIGGTGVVNLPNRAEYDKRIGELDFPLQFQKYVVGKPFATDVFFDRGVPVCWALTEQLHRWPTNFAPSTARRLIHVPEMEEYIRIIGAYTGYHGFGSIDSILPADGGPPLLCEMNPRPAPAFSLFPQYVEMYGSAVARMIAGEPQPTHTPPVVATGTVGLYPESLYHLAERPLDMRRWWTVIGSFTHTQRNDKLLLQRMTKLVFQKILDQYRFDRPLRNSFAQAKKRLFPKGSVGYIEKE